jgi:hypothetical protein
MDNYATHKTAAIRAWLARRPHYHVHFTPTSASWINPVKRWFAELTRKKLRRGVHTSTSQLEADIRSFIERHNQNPKPYKWTKSADGSSQPSSASAKRQNRPYVANFRFTSLVKALSGAWIASFRASEILSARVRSHSRSASFSARCGSASFLGRNFALAASRRISVAAGHCQSHSRSPELEANHPCAGASKTGWPNRRVGRSRLKLFGLLPLHMVSAIYGRRSRRATCWMVLWAA